MICLTVHTQNEDGSVATGCSVFLDIHGCLAAEWMEDTTDEYGDADFELDYSGSIDITFIVDDITYQTESVKDGACVYITVH